MATPKIVADFETQLATALSVGDTSFTLASATDDDGVSLPAGKYYFTIDNGTSQKEYVVGTVSGASVTSVSNVTRQGTESSGVDRAHRVGASVIISDFLTYKNYIDETTTAGAADADTNTKGVVEVPTTAEIDADTATGSTGASLAVSPDQLVLSKYGTRLPSADEKTYLTAIEQGTLPPQVVTFTSSGTWTKDAGLKYVVVEVVGGGGGGQSASSLSAASGGGGGAGGYSRKLIPASSLGATETVTVGTGGAGGVAGNLVEGTDGGNSTFGVQNTGSGGEGGKSNGASGGEASGGDVNITGNQGSLLAGSSAGTPEGGAGAIASAGRGGRGGENEDENGQAGADGIVIVTEYYS